MRANERAYHILRPVSTHWRPATCEEVECPEFLNGWRTRIPWGDEALLATLRASGRQGLETTGIGDAEREFLFNPGQPCFRSSLHRLPVDRPALYRIRDGVRQPQRVSSQGWHDDLGEHLDRLRAIQEKG